MSFFDDASLVFLPSGEAGKDGKAYSMKPTNGDGDFTFSRGSNLTATRVDSNGLIEKGRENLLLQSNQFDTTWTTSNASVTSGQSGYDGSTDAWLLEADSDGNGRRVQQSKTQGGVTTLSIYAKAGTTDWLRIEFGGAASLVYFDLTNGVLGSETNAIGKIESVGNGWYRCSAANTSGSTPSTMRYHLASDNNNIAVLTGDNIYIQDAQLEEGLVATEYIESGATKGKAGLLEHSPRFDYSGGASCPSLLLEPSRTNLIGYSEYLSSIFSGIRMDINDLVDTSPEGFINASKLIPDTTPNSTHQSNTSNYGSFVSGDKITISIFAKADGFDGIILRFLDSSGAFTTNRIAKFDLSRGRWENSSMDGTIGVMEGEVGMEALGNGWYRCFATATADATGDVDIRIPVADVTTQDTYNEVFTGDGTKGVLIYGLQLEQGSYPTSYIPNHSGGSVTRNADAAMTIPTAAFEWDGLADGDSATLFIETKVTAVQNNNFNILSQGGSGVWKWNLTTFFARTNNPATAPSFNMGVDINTLEGSTIKIAFVKDDRNLKMFYNGSSMGVVAIGTAELDWCSHISSAYQSTQSLQQCIGFPSALSDANCITLTS